MTQSTLWFGSSAADDVPHSARSGHYYSSAQLDGRNRYFKSLSSQHAGCVV